MFSPDGAHLPASRIFTIVSSAIGCAVNFRTLLLLLMISIMSKSIAPANYPPSVTLGFAKKWLMENIDNNIQKNQVTNRKDKAGITRGGGVQFSTEEECRVEIDFVAQYNK